MTETDVAKVGRQVADALDFMHSRGFAHCDVKVGCCGTGASCGGCDQGSPHGQIPPPPSAMQERKKERKKDHASR